MSTFLTDAGIINVDLPTQNTEVAIPLPDYVTEITIQARQAVDLKLAFRAGLSGTQFFTVKAAPAPPLVLRKHAGNPASLYVQCGTAGTDVEVLWRS